MTLRAKRLTLRAMSGATVANTACRALLAYCRERGIDTHALLKESGIAERSMLDPKARVRAVQAQTLWGLALGLTKDPSLGLHVGEGVAFGTYPIFNYLALGAPTVGIGLTRAASYFPLIHSAVELRVTERPRDVHITMVSVDPKLSLARPYVEYVLSSLYLHSRFASGRPWVPAKVEFGFRRLERSREHERVFGCAVAFGRPASRLIIERATWDRPTQNTLPGLLELVEAQARSELDKHPHTQRSFVQQVQAALTEELKGKEPRIDDIAKRLSMTKRSLQRRLAEANTSFSAEVDNARREQARYHLHAQSLSLSEIAFLLGFSEQSALTRAVKRWFGCAPSALLGKAGRK